MDKAQPRPARPAEDLEALAQRDILSVAQSAAVAGVTEADISEWIRSRGLKATPVGSVGRRGPRRYLILRRWLYENIEAHAVVAVPADAASDPAPAAPEPPRVRRGPSVAGALVQSQATCCERLSSCSQP